MKFNLSHAELKDAEKSVYSQGAQDGVLEVIFKQLGIGKGFFVEFGGRDGVEISNTANLRINHGWDGLLMDVEPLSDIVKKEFITPDNINEILHPIGAKNIDLFSIDIDGNDYYVWEAIGYYPAKVIVIEYNSKFRSDESFVIEYNENQKWQGDDYYGASLLALKKLGEKKGYTLVYVVAQFDAIFIRNDLLDSNYIATPIEVLLPRPIIAHNVISNKKWIEVK